MKKKAKTGKEEVEELMLDLFGNEFCEIDFIPDEDVDMVDILDNMVGLGKMAEIQEHHTKHKGE